MILLISFILLLLSAITSIALLRVGSKADKKMKQYRENKGDGYDEST